MNNVVEMKNDKVPSISIIQKHTNKFIVNNKRKYGRSLLKGYNNFLMSQFTIDFNIVTFFIVYLSLNAKRTIKSSKELVCGGQILLQWSDKHQRQILHS